MNMVSRIRLLLRYSIPVFSVTAGLMLSLLLAPLTNEAAFLLFVAAVMVSAWYGGLGASLLATALAVLTSSYFLLPPLYTLNMADPNDVVHLGLFILVAVLISSLHQKVRSAQRQAEELARGKEELLSREKTARVEAEAATRARDEFVAMVSHELRTPITAILGWAELLKRCGNSDTASINQALEAIERNARMQAHLINDLMDISRINTGNLKLDMRPVELSTVINAALDAVRPTAAAKHIQFRVMLDPGPGLVFGDLNRLQQVVWNLLSNAIKFTPREGSIQIRLARVASQLEVAVSDNGKGISQEFLPRVFEPFSQSDTASKYGGLGLGLAIARELVELHGGTIEVKSPGEGLGSTFRIKLPAFIATESQSQSKREQPEDNDAESGLKTLVASER
jgi:signal transduction histidine kinase